MLPLLGLIFCLSIFTFAHHERETQESLISFWPPFLIPVPRPLWTVIGICVAETTAPKIASTRALLIGLLLKNNRI